MTPADLEQFISEAAAAGATRLVLRAVRPEARGEPSSYVPLCAWELAEGSDHALVADSILEHSRTDARDCGALQHYSLFAVDEGKDVVQRRWSIAGGLGTELAERGGGAAGSSASVAVVAQVVSQEMRHNENLMRTIENLVARATKRDERELTRLIAQNDRYAARELAVMEKYEALASQEHARALELTEVQARLEQKGKALALIEPVVPMLIAKMLKNPLTPAESTNALDAFLTSVTQEQAAKLPEIFNAGQLTALQALFSERAAAQTKADEAKKPKGTNGAPTK